MDLQAIAPPQSLAEVEQLVKLLYTPGNAEIVNQIQEQLQTLQHSPEGWQMAEKLLESTDSNVKFFGALTYTVKINTCGQDLSDEEFEQLQTRLIYWLSRLISQGEAKGLVLKLCSALVACVLHPTSPKSQFIRQIALSLNGNTVSNGVPSLSDFNHNQLLGLLWFATVLTEEADRREVVLTPQLATENRKHIEMNMEDAVGLMEFALLKSANESSSSNLPQASVSCFANWVFYAYKAWYRETDMLDPLRTLIAPALQCCTKVEDSIEIIDSFIDMLGASGGFFQEEHHRAISEIITSQWGQSMIAGLGEDPMPANLAFARLLLAYGDSDLDNIITKPNDPAAQQILEMMHFVLKTPGYPSEDDDLSIEAITFWVTLVEYVIDQGYDSDTSSSWIDYAKRHVMQMVEEVWRKARYPPSAEYSDWDADQKKVFWSWRMEINDLMLFCHTILGTSLLEGFARLLLNALQQKEWIDLEASVFCINSLADALKGEDHEDKILSELFGSSLFTELANPDQTIPSRVRKTAVDMLGLYDQFMMRRTEFLPPALNFLFAGLEASFLANTAARSIFLLSSTCRESLTAELAAFFQQYERFLTWNTADTFTKQRVIGAIASIAQALSKDEDSHVALNKLLDFVDADIHKALTYMANGQADESQAAGISALSCLASVSEAFQAPNEVPIDLDSDPNTPNYWNDGPGAEAQLRITQFLASIIEILGNQGDVIEEACKTLKSGLRETSPGPFVLRPQVIVDFICRTTVQTPRLESVLSTACALLSAHTPGTTKKLDGEAVNLLTHLNGLLQSLGNPRTDPEISQACIDVLTRFMPRYTDVLLGQEAAVLEGMLMFVIHAIRIPEPLPKRAASKFWTTLIALPASKHQNLDPVISHFGPPISHSLIFGIGGEASRSDLDALCDPLKKLITRTPQAKGWLEQALISPAFPSRRVDEAAKKKFLMMIMAERGGGKTKSIAEEFWAKCRGRVLGS